MNNVCISGRLVREPDSVQFPSNTNLTTIFLANDVYFGQDKKTGVYKVKAWGKLGDVVAKHCKTGTEIFVGGKLEQHTYQDKNGTTIYDVSLIMDNFNFGNNKKEVVSEEETNNQLVEE